MEGHPVMQRLGKGTGRRVPHRVQRGVAYQSNRPNSKNRIDARLRGFRWGFEGGG